MSAPTPVVKTSPSQPTTPKGSAATPVATLPPLLDPAQAQAFFNMQVQMAFQPLAQNLLQQVDNKNQALLDQLKSMNQAIQHLSANSKSSSAPVDSSGSNISTTGSTTTSNINTSQVISHSSSNANLPKLISITGIKPIMNQPRGDQLERFIKDVELQFASQNLLPFIKQDLSSIISIYQKSYPNLTQDQLISAVSNQSHALSATLYQALASHSDRILTDISALTIPAVLNISNNYNTFVVWSYAREYLNQQVNTPKNTNACLIKLLQLRYNSKETPNVIYDRIQSLRRQLDSGGLTLPDAFYAQMLINSIPIELDGIRQNLIIAEKAGKLPNGNYSLPSLRFVYDSMLHYFNTNDRNKHTNNDDQKAYGASTTPSSASKKKSNKKQFDKLKQQAAAAAKALQHAKDEIELYKQRKKSDSSALSDVDSDSDSDLAQVGNVCVVIDSSFSVSSRSSIEHTCAPATSITGIADNNDLILDSGCTTNIVANKRLLTDIKPIAPVKVLGIGGHVIEARQAGTLNINNKIRFINVLYAPANRLNLISLRKIFKYKLKAEFTFAKATVKNRTGKAPLMTFSTKNDLWIHTMKSNDTHDDISDEPTVEVEDYYDDGDTKDTIGWTGPPSEATKKLLAEKEAKKAAQAKTTSQVKKGVTISNPPVTGVAPSSPSGTSATSSSSPPVTSFPPTFASSSRAAPVKPRTAAEAKTNAQQLIAHNAARAKRDATLAQPRQVQRVAAALAQALMSLGHNPYSMLLRDSDTGVNDDTGTGDTSSSPVESGAGRQ